MKTSIYNNIKNDKEFKASTGLKKSEFDALLNIFKKLYIPKKEKPYEGCPETALRDPAEALFFILHYYKAYPTLICLGIYFGFSEYTASHHIERIKPFLAASFAASGLSVRRDFKNQADFDAAFEGVADIFIDATEITIQRPSDKETQKENYSGKKKTTL